MLLLFVLDSFGVKFYPKLLCIWFSVLVYLIACNKWSLLPRCEDPSLVTLICHYEKVRRSGIWDQEIVALHFHDLEHLGTEGLKDCFILSTFDSNET